MYAAFLLLAHVQGATAAPMSRWEQVSKVRNCSDIKPSRELNPDHTKVVVRAVYQGTQNGGTITRQLIGDEAADYLSGSALAQKWFTYRACLLDERGREPADKVARMVASLDGLAPPPDKKLHWDLSQRWRHTTMLDLVDETTGGVVTGRVGNVAYESAYESAWFQRTRFSANIADHKAVRLMLGTDGQFRHLLELAAAYLSDRWLLGIESGSFPQSTTVVDDASSSLATGDLVPDEEDTPRSFSSFTAAIQPNTELLEGLYLGLMWTRLVLPTRIAWPGAHDASETDEVRAIFDGATRYDIVGIIYGGDLTRRAINQGCDGTACVRPAFEIEMRAGLASIRASKEAEERFEAAQPPWDPEGTDIRGNLGLGVGNRLSAGVLTMVPAGGGLVSVEAGLSGRNLFVIGFDSVRGDKPTYLSPGGDAIGVEQGNLQLLFYYGPHIEVFTRF